MKIYLLLSILLLSSGLIAQTPKFAEISSNYFNERVQVERTSEKILIKGKDCLVLKNEARAIGIWAKKAELLGSVRCECIGSECSMEINSISPGILLKQQSVCMLKDGPNCWNASLNAAGLADGLRYSTPEEMNFWMESPLCTERKAGEKPSPGDVIAIRSIKDKEVHGFTYLSENLSFSKNGYRSHAPYTLQDPKHVYKVYGVPLECQGIYKAPKEEDTQCLNYSNIFKCEPLEDYLKSKPKMREEQRALIQEMKEFECDIMKITGSTDTLQPSLKEIILTSIKAIKALAIQNQETKNKDEKFIWKIIEIRADAIQAQIPVL